MTTATPSGVALGGQIDLQRWPDLQELAEAVKRGKASAQCEMFSVVVGKISRCFDANYSVLAERPTWSRDPLHGPGRERRGCDEGLIIQKTVEIGPGESRVDVRLPACHNHCHVYDASTCRSLEP